ENFANYVVGMEFSYGKLSVSMPRPEELPLEWNFAGARPRGVIGYGTIAEGSPQRLHKLHAITTLLTSVSPWPASQEAMELYKILKPLGDLEQYRFEDWRNQVVELDDSDCISAAYSREGAAYLLLANLKPEAKDVTLTVDPTRLSFSLATVQSAKILAPESGARQLNPKKLLEGTETIVIPGDDVVLIYLD
ncbi:MAG TPA: hypothetical protein VMY18_12515, partial [Acidobacteriota bacterium]|nr:hypothetical protein [Acidobacteriota bacterium]